jgi:hypothetical protein
MKPTLCAILLLMFGVSHFALASDRDIHLIFPANLQKNITSTPQIAHPVDEAQHRINEDLKRLNTNVLVAAKDCKGDGWSRFVQVPMVGPYFLSVVITDSVFCDGNAYPDSTIMSVVYDLKTGHPVDWTHLLPPSLTGKLTMEEQGDGTRIVTLESKHLFDLYMVGYAKDNTGADAKECKQALEYSAINGPPDMMVWLDKKLGGLVVNIGLAHVVANCEDEVVIPVSVLQREGASKALLEAF